MDEELEAVVIRIMDALRQAGWQGVEWDGENDWIEAYDEQSEHTLGITVGFS